MKNTSLNSIGDKIQSLKIKNKSKFISNNTKEVKTINVNFEELDNKIFDYIIKLRKNLFDITPKENLRKLSFIKNNDKNLNLNLPSITSIPFEFSIDTYNIIEYIFTKKIKNKNEILYIQHFLTNFKHFISELNKTRLLYNTNLLLSQISKYMKMMKLLPNQLLFRYGDKGDKFYFLFSGQVAIIVPKEIQIKVNYDEYINHLNKLFSLKEYGLVLKIIEENISKFNSFEVLEYKNLILDLLNKKTNEKEFSKKNFSFDNKLMNKDNNNKIKLNSSQLYKEIITIEDYLNSVLPNLEDKNEEEENLINKNYKNKKVTFQNEKKVRNLILDLPNRKKKKLITLYIYYQIGILNQFSTFGDIALGASSSNRTATIICLEQTSLGHIENKIYSNCIKKNFDVLRFKNISLIRKIPLFQDLSIDKFNEKYFNDFHLHIYKRGEIIFNQLDKRKKIYLIKEGEIELSMRGSIKDLNKIISEFNPDDILIRNRLIRNQKFEDDFLAKFYNNDNEINFWKISYLFPCDIFGLDDCIFGDKYFISAICKTENALIYEIDIEFFLNMINEKNVYNNYINYVNSKKSQMIKRLQYIRQNIINFKYFDKETYSLDFPEIKRKRNLNLNMNTIKKDFNEKILFLKKKEIKRKKDKNETEDISSINIKFNNFSPLKNKKHMTQNTTDNSSIHSPQHLSLTNTFNQAKNKINTSKKYISKIKIKNNNKKEINIINRNSIDLLNNQKLLSNKSSDINSNEKEKYHSSLTTYIKNVKKAKLKRPKIDIFSEFMFQLSKTDFTKNKNSYNNNSDDDNTVDFLAFDSLIQNKFNLSQKKNIMLKNIKTKKRQKSVLGFKGGKLKSIYKNYIVKE